MKHVLLQSLTFSLFLCRHNLHLKSSCCCWVKALQVDLLMVEVEAGAAASASPCPLLLGRHLQPLLQADKSMPAVRQAATRSTVQWNGRQVHAPVSTILTTQSRWATTKAELCWAQSWPLASLLSRLQDQDSRRWRELPGSTVQVCSLGL